MLWCWQELVGSFVEGCHFVLCCCLIVMEFCCCGCSGPVLSCLWCSLAPLDARAALRQSVHFCLLPGVCRMECTGPGVSPQGSLVAPTWLFGGCDLVSSLAENWGQMSASQTRMPLRVSLGFGVGSDWLGPLLKAVAVSFFVAEVRQSDAAVVAMILFLSCLQCFIVR